MNKKKTTYIRLVRLLISNDKKIVFLFMIFLVIGFTFLFTIPSLTGTMIETKQDEAIDRYGKFLAVIPDIREKDEKKIRKQYRGFSYTHFWVLGNVRHKDKNIATGYMDEAMGENLGFHLVKGKWPKDSDQVVVEEYLLNLFGIEKEALPVSISFKNEENRITYEVTGVISNYSSFLPVSDDGHAETKIYPSMICGESGYQEGKKSFVILQEKLDLRKFKDDLNILAGIPVDTVCLNTKLYRDGYADHEDMIYVRVWYLSLSNFLLSLALIIIIRAFLLRNKKTLFLFEAFGLCRKERRRVIFYLFQSLVWFGCLMGYLFAGMLGFLYKNFVFEEYIGHYMKALHTQFLVEVLIMGALLFGFYVFYVILQGEMIIREVMEEKAIRHKNKYRFQKFDVQMICLQTICMFFVMMSCYIVHVFQGEAGEVNYDLYSKISASSYAVREFRMADYGENYFFFDELKVFEGYSDFIHLSADAETGQSTILFEKDTMDPYFQRYCEKVDIQSEKEQELWKQISNRAGKYQGAVISKVQFNVLQQKEFRLFLKKKGITDFQPGKDTERTCVLCLPDVLEESARSIQKKGAIRLGRVQKNGDKAEFFTEEFGVSAVCSCDGEDGSSIQIVMSDVIAKRSKIVLGYDTIHVVVKKKTPISVQKQIEEKISILMASIQGGMLDSSGERNRRDELIRNFGSAVSTTMLLFCILVLWIYMTLSIYVDKEKHSHEYGVLRSFGMSYMTLQNKLFYRCSISMMIAVILGILIGKAFYIYSALTQWQIFLSIGITEGVTILCRVWLYALQRKETISSMLGKE